MAATYLPTYGTTISGLASQVEVESDFLRNQIWRDQVLLKNDKPLDLMMQLEVMGKVRTVGTNIPTWLHIEKDVYSNRFTVDAEPAPAIGVGYTLTISAGGQNYNSQGQAIALEGNYVRFPDGSIGKIDVVTIVGPNNWTLDILPHNPTQLPAVAQGDMLTMLGNSVGEAAVADSSFLVTDVYAYDHSTQAFAYKWKISDFRMAYDSNGKFTIASPTIDVPNPFTNGTTKSWVSYELSEWKRARMMEISNTKLFNRRSALGGVVALSDPRFSDGLIPFIEDGGLNFVTPATMTFPWLEAAAQAFIEARHGAVSHEMLVGRGFWSIMNTFLLSLPGQDNRQGVGNTSYNNGITAINGLAGHDFSMRMCPAFDDAGSALPWQGFSDTALFLPRGTDDMADTLSGERAPLISLVYQDAYAGMNGNLGNGREKWVTRKGRDFCEPGEQAVLNANELELEFGLTLGMDLRQPDRFAISK
jgi:hypothetical protein